MPIEIGSPLGLLPRPVVFALPRKRKATFCPPQEMVRNGKRKQRMLATKMTGDTFDICPIASSFNGRFEQSYDLESPAWPSWRCQVIQVLTIRSLALKFHLGFCGNDGVNDLSLLNCCILPRSSEANSATTKRQTPINGDIVTVDGPHRVDRNL